MSTLIEKQNGQVVHDNATAQKINKLLNSSKTRTEGFQLLNWFLPYCSDEDFLQFCVSWMHSCCKLEALAKNRDSATYLLGDLFRISSNFQELKKSVSFFITTRYFDYFFKHLLNSQVGWRCTASCLLHYRGACGPFQAALKKHLMNIIEKKEKISLVVGECFALIPCIGRSGNENVNFKKNWNSQFIYFLEACHFVLNNLFANVEEFQEYLSLENTYNKNNKEKSADHLSAKLHNYILLLNCMLLNQYPAPKSIPPEQIFQLVCRGLTVNLKALTEQETASIIALKKVLPEVQCYLLSLLKALIVTCKNQLLPYSYLICKLITHTLEWTENDFNFDNGISFGRLRILAYEALCDWLAVARNGSCVELISNAVVSNATDDIKSKKKVVFLKETKLQNEFKERGETISGIDTPAKSRLCHAALKALQFLLKFSGVVLKSEEHKFLQEFVVMLILEVQRSSSLDVPVPFHLPACRTELYALLLELTCQPCPTWPPPTNYALRLFSKGVNDSSPEVSSLCSAALNIIAIIIHPQYDNGGFSQSETTCNNSLTEFQMEDRENLMEIENEKESDIDQENVLSSNEKSLEPDKVDEPEILNDLNEESNVSSDEDSRSTVKFVKDVAEPGKANFSVDESESDKCLEQSNLEDNEPASVNESESDKCLEQSNLEDDEPASVNESESDKCLEQSNREDDEPALKRQKIADELTPEKTSSCDKEKVARNNSRVQSKGTQDNDKVKNFDDYSHLEEFFGLKDVSSESINEEGHSKARYFLRSKTKASSEEPEEVSKINTSTETVKNWPTRSLGKNSVDVNNPKKRRRTRASSKIETNTEPEPKTSEKKSQENDSGEGLADEEDIKAAFIDSFIG